MITRKVVFTRLFNQFGVEYFRISEYANNKDIIDTVYFEYEDIALTYYYEIVDKNKLVLVNRTYTNHYDRKMKRYEELIKTIVSAKVKEETYNKLRGI